MSNCQHCHERPISRSRRLCTRCFYAPGVRDLYPTATSQEPPRAVCWACGCECAEYHRLPQIGWQLRYINLPGGTTSEVYCAACFKVWGWPDWSKAYEPRWDDENSRVRGIDDGRAGRIERYCERAGRRLPLFAEPLKEAA